MSDNEIAEQLIAIRNVCIKIHRTMDLVYPMNDVSMDAEWIINELGNVIVNLLTKNNINNPKVNQETTDRYNNDGG